MSMGIVMDVFKKTTTRHNELLLHLYAFGMLSPDHLATLMETSKSTIINYVYRLNKNGEMVVSHYPPRSKRVREKLKGQPGAHMYSLGLDGLKVVEELLDIEADYQVKSLQKEHYWGIGETFCRLYSHLGFDSTMERIDWENTWEATKRFADAWHEKRGKDINDKFKYMKAKSQLPRPDLYMKIDGNGLYGEYDTGSEGITGRSAKVVPKMKLYIKWMVVLNDHTPIAWITDTESRRKSLQDAWQEIKQEPVYEELKESPEFFFPKMLFLTLDEVPQLIN